MPKRNDKRDTAKAEYIKRRRSGEKVNLKDLAEKLRGTARKQKQPGQEECQGQSRRRCAERKHQRREGRCI